MNITVQQSPSDLSTKKVMTLRINEELSNPCYEELSEGGQDAFKYLKDEEALASLTWKDFSTLLKHHVDVFGLIQEGKAININKIHPNEL